MRASRGLGGQQGFGGFDFGNIDLGDLFGGMFNQGQRGGRRTQRGQDIQVDIEIDFLQSVSGLQREIRLNKRNSCDVCTGSGHEPGSKLNTCSECKGSGQVQRVQRTMFGAMQSVAMCGTCQGKGQIPEKKCKHCDGSGVVHNESKLDVKIPAGIYDGASIRLSGKGEYPGAGGQAGDLYVRVHVKPHPEFERDDFDVHTSLRITYPQAVLGDQVEISTVDGKKTIVVPEATASGQQIRLKNLGMPFLDGQGRGDHYVTVIVDVPKKLSRKAKKMIEELKTEL